MGVNHAADLRIGAIHFAVDRKLVVALALAGKRVAVEVDQHHVVFGRFFETDARAFDPVLSGFVGQRRDMAVDHIVVALHGQYPAGKAREFSRSRKLVLQSPSM